MKEYIVVADPEGNWEVKSAQQKHPRENSGRIFRFKATSKGAVKSTFKKNIDRFLSVENLLRIDIQYEPVTVDDYM
jgi:hypothetical protein